MTHADNTTKLRPIIAILAAARRLRLSAAMALAAGCIMAMVSCASRAGSPAPGEPSSISAAQRLEFIAPHMGMAARIVLYSTDAQRAKVAAGAAMAEIALLDRVLSDWRDDSDVARVNAAAGGPPERVDRRLIDILDRAIDISQLSDGAFDVTIGPVTQRWRNARVSGREPGAEELDAAHALVDWREIGIDHANATVGLARTGMRLDLGGIGKGYAADRALAVLRDHGIASAIVDLGGDMAIGDPPPHQPGWRVDVDDAVRNEPVSLMLANCGIATSGDAFQSLTIDGLPTRSHIIDPQHGLGLTSRLAVTVIAADATAADALATAVSVMGPERGLALIEGVSGAAARVTIAHDGEVETRASSAFESRPTARAPAK